MRLIKEKTYQGQTFVLRIPLELYDLPTQDGTPLLIELAC
jgi:hypothetical protein